MKKCINNIEFGMGVNSVLIVGGEGDDHKGLIIMLQSLGVIKIYEATNTDQAMKLLSSESINPGVLIADFFMREIDGFKLIKRMVENQISTKLLIVGGLHIDIVILASKIANHGGLNYLGSIERPIKLDLLRRRLAS
jgi:PleD family two-component response regulator